MFREKPKPPIPPQEDKMLQEYFYLGNNISIERILEAVKEKYPDAEVSEISIYAKDNDLQVDFWRLTPNENYEQQRQEYGISYAQYAEDVIKWRAEYEDFNRNNAKENG